MSAVYRIVFFIFLCLHVIHANAQAAGTALPNLDSILQQHYAATGDFSRLQSRRVKLRIIGMAPFEIPSTVEAKRPNLLRRDVFLQGQVQSSAHDGKDAWKIDPFLSSGKQTVNMPTDELPALIEEAYFDGILVAAQKSGFQLRYQGEEKLDGKSVHVIKVSVPGTGESSIYLDASNFLEVKRVQKRPVMGQMTELEIFSMDYRKQDGLQLPFRIEIGTKGASQRMRMIIDQVDNNPVIAASRFQRPAGN
ncbi:hypothetical protein H8L32_17350 [Undibacterium sp. CY18W]|uniref:Outer membrane lipoprotein-sorting protein n=1 Tax=Undibacterium hunanense TaxID=2762292 RepID=A0ABR6ZUF5_9BURK|nr:hypothetical protein [Undibacterium hunanense]MBC3919259.1 hypothetical protein [Undibacterium hunanense]